MQSLIKNIRLYLNMSQTEFADKLNITFATVNRWENGRSFPNKMAQVNLYELCKKNAVPVYDFTVEKIKEEAKNIEDATNRTVFFHGSKAGIEGRIEPKAADSVTLERAFIWARNRVRQ